MNMEDITQVPEQQPSAVAANDSQAELRTALTAANELLISSLAAGNNPTTSDAELDAQIAAYRASIADITRQLGQSCDHADPAVTTTAGAAAPASDSSQGKDQNSTDRRPGDADGSRSVLPGLGQEGIDYTVGTADDLDPSEWQVPPHCIPIHANVTTFDWSKLYSVTSFDVIMMDPPWQLATANPTRGVALGYSQLTDHDICNLPIPQLQRAGGFLFVWVINSKYKFTLDLFERWGYMLVDEIVWVKMTVNRRLFKSHGYYLQHAKEVCMVARKASSLSEQQQHPPLPLPQQQQQQQQLQRQLSNASAGEGAGAAAAAAAAGDPGCSQPGGAGSSGSKGLGCSSSGVGSDVIFSERRGQSQKPEEIYELIEALVPAGRYLEIFARKNNLRNFWVSVGNEVTGTGLPEEDMQAFQQRNHIPGAVYGRGSTSSAAPTAAAAAAGGSS